MIGQIFKEIYKGEQANGNGRRVRRAQPVQEQIQPTVRRAEPVEEDSGD
jgi:hypothetical protein